MAFQARSAGQIGFLVGGRFWRFLAIFGDFWWFFGYLASTVRHSAQCSKGVKLTKLGIQILVLQRGVYIISDSQELKFLKFIIGKYIFYGPKVRSFTPFWPF